MKDIEVIQKLTIAYCFALNSGFLCNLYQQPIMVFQYKWKSKVLKEIYKPINPRYYPRKG